MSPLAIVLGILSGLLMSPVQDGVEQVTPEPVAHLEIVLTDLRAPEGSVRLGLYATAADWDAGRSVDSASLTVEGDEIHIRFESLEPGSYGIKAYHDRDGNGELNTGMFGIPSEPFAFSNDARGRMGPASWADAAFDIAAGENQHTIRLR